MSRRALLLLCGLMIGASSLRLYGDMVVIDGRSVTDRTTISGAFYATDESAGGQVVFRFGFGGVMGSETRYLCSDKWDWEKIRPAALAVKKYLDTHDSIVVTEMLKELGFTFVRIVNR